MGAICFSGEVSAGNEFHKDLNDNLGFALVGNWGIVVVPKVMEEGCDKESDFTLAVNPPFRAHNELEIDEQYGWTAEDEVSDSPREFSFVTNCKDNRIESERLQLVLWPYEAKDQQEADKALADLGSSPLGTGKMWITASRISHIHDTPDDKSGTIEWMRFTVEIQLPKKSRAKPLPPKK